MTTTETSATRSGPAAAAAGEAGAVVRTSQLGGQTRGRGVFWGYSKLQIAVAVLALIVGLLLLLVVRTLWLLVLEVAVAVAVAWVLHRRTAEGDLWSWWAREGLRGRVAHWTGTDRYDPDETERPRPLPWEMGRVTFAAASVGNSGRLCVADHHTGGYVSTVLRVSGGGAGLRDVAETNRVAARFGQFLYGLSAPALPVDQVDLSTRAVPLAGDDLRAWAQAQSSPSAPPAARDNLLGLAEAVTPGREHYESWLVIRMPREGLAHRVEVADRIPTPEAVAEEAWRVTGQVARAADQHGLRVSHGLSPRQFAALVRHLYDPSCPLEDEAGLSGPRDGWRPYRAYPRFVEVPSRDGGRWCHATASVPRDGWPLEPVQSRWLDHLVTGAPGGGPPIVRTVTAQFHFLHRRAARARAEAALTSDQASLVAQRKKGQVSTGEHEAQANAAERVLSDVLGQAAGCRPALRVTVSARTPGGVTDAREMMESAAQSAQLNRLDWHDGRHHHGHQLTLPVARGVAR